MVERFLVERKEAIKRAAESNDWKQYLATGMGGRP